MIINLIPANLQAFGEDVYRYKDKIETTYNLLPNSNHCWHSKICLSILSYIIHYICIYICIHTYSKLRSTTCFIVQSVFYHLKTYCKNFSMQLTFFLKHSFLFFFVLFLSFFKNAWFSTVWIYHLYLTISLWYKFNRIPTFIVHIHMDNKAYISISVDFLLEIHLFWGIKYLILILNHSPWELGITAKMRKKHKKIKSG